MWLIHLKNSPERFVYVRTDLVCPSLIKPVLPSICLSAFVSMRLSASLSVSNVSV